MMKALHVSFFICSASAQTMADIKPSDLIWPFSFETKTLQWPQIYITPNYLLEGRVSGYLAIDSLDEDLIEEIKATKDPSKAQFSFYTEVKIDTVHNRAM